jgi:hypothetical protein
MGVEVVDNTPDEVNEAVVEMIDTLDSRVAYTAEDDEFQLRYHSCCRSPEHPIPAGGARIARDMRRQSYLLR